jgi:hypothetical protein
LAADLALPPQATHSRGGPIVGRMLRTAGDYFFLICDIDLLGDLKKGSKWNELPDLLVLPTNGTAAPLKNVNNCLNTNI